MFFGKKKNPHETCCYVCHVIMTALLFLASVASLLGVVMTHYNAEESAIIFGTTQGSIALAVFAFVTASTMKSAKACMSSCEACGTNGKK